MKNFFTGLVLLALALPFSVFSEQLATMRQGAAIDIEEKPLPIAKVDNSDVKRQRNYPMQPPLIPHQIRNYQVDVNSNKCLSCHARSRTQESQATMISVTHYMDRDGNFLADVSPRRYFCEQCHVVQTNAKPLVGNVFKDIDTMIRDSQARQQGGS